MGHGARSSEPEAAELAGDDDWCTVGQKGKKGKKNRAGNAEVSTANNRARGPRYWTEPRNAGRGPVMAGYSVDSVFSRVTPAPVASTEGAAHLERSLRKLPTSQQLGSTKSTLDSRRPVRRWEADG